MSSPSSWAAVPHPSTVTLKAFNVLHIVIGVVTVVLNGVSGYLIVFKSAKPSKDFRKYLLSTVVSNF